MRKSRACAFSVSPAGCARITCTAATLLQRNLRRDLVFICYNLTDASTFGLACDIPEATQTTEMNLSTAVRLSLLTLSLFFAGLGESITPRDSTRKRQTTQHVFYTDRTVLVRGFL